MRLLIVEDDDRVSGALRAALSRQGFQVTCAATAAAALRLLDTDPDVMLLDIGLPDLDGLRLCGEIRRVSDVPVIMTTARGRIATRVAGFAQGADDYLVKPYNLAELVARIHAIARRRTRPPETGEVRGGSNGAKGANGVDADGGPGRTRLAAGLLRVDLDAWSAEVDGTPLALTRREFALLAVLVRHRDEVVPHEGLVEEFWPDLNPPNARRTLHVHIAALRNKLGPRCPIETVHGVGYRLVGAVPGAR